jgi:hypothetical protein
VTAALVFVSATASFAQFDGTPQEQAACRPDVRKHCRDLKADAGSPAFLACLQANRAKLSKSCRAVLESHGQ